MSKAERTRQFIIEKAAPIFNKKGYFATSLSDITLATGLTKGGIYGNFKDKDDLALTVYTYNSKKLADSIKKQMAEKETAYKKLSALLDFYRTNWTVISKSGGCPFMNAATEADDMLPVLRQKVKRSFDLWKNQFQFILEEGIHNREFKPDIAPAAYSVYFVAMIEGGILLSKVSGKATDLYTVLDKIERMIDTEIRK